MNFWYFLVHDMQKGKFVSLYKTHGNFLMMVGNNMSIVADRTHFIHIIIIVIFNIGAICTDVQDFNVTISKV